MATVRTILESKGNVVHSVGPGETVLDALRTLADKNIGALVVTSGGKVVGIFSERDYARKVALRGRSSQTTPVTDVMTPDVVSVTPDQTIEECMALMTAKHVRHLPVIDGGALVGMVSIGDVVKETVQEKERTIQQLTNYITGAR